MKENRFQGKRSSKLDIRHVGHYAICTLSLVIVYGLLILSSFRLAIIIEALRKASVDPFQAILNLNPNAVTKIHFKISNIYDPF